MTEPKKFLIIDDDPDFVEGIMSILVNAGYEVDAKYNPKEGYEALETGKYDLLLLDIMMGRGAEGVMIARKMR
ncbi:MAG: response regulator, partial [Anaerolineales bacterium]|nr:response regulator [Anaerolineales bacterium]